jgi:L-alanine-DL-glutamate epimerase-like enolase superfamily enzyme
MEGQFALVPEEPGIGVTMDEDKIAEFTIALD